MNSIMNKIHSLFSRGKLSSSNDSGKVQKVKASLLAGELKDDMERLQEYGFTSRPPDNSEALILSIGGNRDHSIVINCNDRTYRINNLEKGEIAFYTDEGDKMHFKRGNKIEIETKELTVNTDKFKVQNSTAELVEELVKLVDELIKTKTITGIGHQPFVPSHITVYEDIKTKLESLKL